MARRRGLGRQDTGDPLCVLVCPGHYQLVPSLGSETGWAVDLITHISRLEGISVEAYAGFSTWTRLGDARVKSFWSRPHRLGVFWRLAFIVRSAAAVRAWMWRRGPVLHHMLPFEVGRTFNVAVLLAGRRRPVVIGPVQRISPRTARPVMEGFAGQQGAMPWSLRAALRLGERPLRYLSALTLHRATAVIAVSSGAREDCLRLTPTCHVEVIAPIVDCVRFTPAAGAEARARTADVPEILMMSYFQPRKRLHLVVQAAALLRDRGVEFRLRIVGDGPTWKVVVGLVRSLDLGGRTEVVGRLANTEVPEAYRRATVLCHPAEMAIGDPAPLEAMACGVPIVVCDPDYLTEIARGVQVGLCTLPTADDVADGIQRIIGDPNLRMQLGEQARSLMLRLYDGPVVAARYGDIYRHVVTCRLPRDHGRGVRRKRDGV